MNHQEIFNTVATHLFNQGRPAARIMRDKDGKEHAGACLYRTDDGLKCAVGVMIPDDIYRISMENRSVKGILESSSFNLPVSIFNDQNIALLQALQLLHDNYTEDESDTWGSTDRMKAAFASLAFQFNLNPSVLDNLKFSDR